MHWTYGGLRLGMIILLYWWGTVVLLRMPVTPADTRAGDEHWMHIKHAAGPPETGANKWRAVLRDVLVYTLLAGMLVSALVWVVCGLVGA